eukprot:IDg9496t1
MDRQIANNGGLIEPSSATVMSENEYSTWINATAQAEHILALRAEKGKGRFRCCQRWACIRVIHEDELKRAVEDTEAARGAGKTLFRMYIKTLYLCSLKPLMPGKLRK